MLFLGGDQRQSKLLEQNKSYARSQYYWNSGERKQLQAAISLVSLRLAFMITNSRYKNSVNQFTNEKIALALMEEIKVFTLLFKQMKRKTKQAIKKYVYNGSGDTVPSTWDTEARGP